MTADLSPQMQPGPTPAKRSITPAMRTAHAQVTNYGPDGAPRRDWHGATINALLRAGLLEESPGVTHPGYVRAVATTDRDKYLYLERDHDAMGGGPRSNTFIDAVTQADALHEDLIDPTDVTEEWAATFFANYLSGLQTAEEEGRKLTLLRNRAVCDAHRVTRHGEPHRLGKVVAVYGDTATATRVQVAWGDNADLVAHIAIADATEEEIDDLIPEPAPGTTLGQMTPDQQRVAVARAAAAMQVELTRTAPAIAAALDPFDPAAVQIERHRWSVTQGEVSVSYRGELLGRYRDDVEICTSGSNGRDPHTHDDGASCFGGWHGRGDRYWIDAAAATIAARTPEASLPSETPAGDCEHSVWAHKTTIRDLIPGKVWVASGPCDKCGRDVHRVWTDTMHQEAANGGHWNRWRPVTESIEDQYPKLSWHHLGPQDYRAGLPDGREVRVHGVYVDDREYDGGWRGWQWTAEIGDQFLTDYHYATMAEARNAVQRSLMAPTRGNAAAVPAGGTLPAGRVGTPSAVTAAATRRAVPAVATRRRERVTVPITRTPGERPTCARAQYAVERQQLGAWVVVDQDTHPILMPNQVHVDEIADFIAQTYVDGRRTRVSAVVTDAQGAVFTAVVNLPAGKTFYTR